MTPLPALLLVHGAWHGPWAWQRLIEQLPDVDVHTVALPSTGSDPAALGNLYDDAAAVTTAVAAIDGPVVVLAHSYGGHPVTQAVASAGNVRRLVYLAAFQLDVGEAPHSIMGDDMPGLEVHVGMGEDGGAYIELTDPVEILYGDLDPGLAQQSVAQLRFQSLVAVTQPLTEAAWRHHPSTYLICEADSALPPSVQEMMAKRAERVRRIQSSHSPFLSRPTELAGLIRDELSL
ncbi:alpha/beta hydrolase [Pseudonocardia sp. CA-142604]|uniref:alpha/beta hydrolase n=1 Tax=Pseudonocardia sp. CA-142604 TaxID=3240024 RepID=UPI003D93B809